MFKKIVSMIQYISWLIEKRHEVNKQGTLFKISEIKQNRLGEHLVLIQLVNQAVTFLCKPSLLVNDDHLLEGFSKRDIRAITYLATQEIFQPKYQIISQQFSDTLKRIIFKIRKRGSQHLVCKSADQLSHDKSILKQLTQEDAHRVGYVTAVEQSMREREFFEQVNHAR